MPSLQSFSEDQQKHNTLSTDIAEVLNLLFEWIDPTPQPIRNNLLLT